MKKRALVFLGVVAFLVPSTAHARGGDMDYFFGRYGYTTADFGGGFDLLTHVAVQSDGKILAGGTSYKRDSDFAIARFTSKGALDKTFSGDGKATVSFGPSDYLIRVAPAPGGKVVAAGVTARESTDGESRGDFALARFTSKGALDKTFSADGKATTDFFAELTDGDYPFAMDVGTDGKIVVGGSTGKSVSAGTPEVQANFEVPAIILARYAADGSLDPTFGGGGRLLLHLGRGPASLAALDVRPDGSILLAGTQSYAGPDHPSDMYVARLTVAGSMDPTFGPGGIVTTDFAGQYDGATAMAISKDGSIVLGGVAFKRDDPYIGLARFTSSGAPDTTFSLDGKTTGALAYGGSVRSMAVQSDGRITIASPAPLCTKIRYGGYTGVTCSYGPAVTRYAKNGSIDKGYGKSGTARVIGVSSLYFGGGAIALQSDRVIYGTSSRAGWSTDFGVVRLQK